jgi:hypothetical protein
VADDASSTPPPPAPGVVDILPAETVEPLLAHHQQDLHALGLELEEASREAEAAERRLGQHPAAAVYDDAFEARVLAHVAQSISNVQGRGDGVVADRNEGVRFAPGNRPPDPPTAAVEGSGSSADPVVEVPDRASEPTARPAPRTVVVDRGAPKTVVVDRRPPPPPASAAAPSAGAEPVVSPEPASKSRGKTREKRRERKTKGHRLQQLPARLLIQAGVVVVIVALLLLKLS